MSLIRTIPQRFWRDARLPWLELRSTWRSRQAYKLHLHPQLSIGAILEGETRCVCNGQEHRLQAGDLIVIPPLAPHSCNPLEGTFRSYHMLWLDTDWCLAQLAALSATTRLSARPRRFASRRSFRTTCSLWHRCSVGRARLSPGRSAFCCISFPCGW
ncbi:cupin domain-containing protein [Escherichia alba]|uniref:Cupin domain-containing protein n=1 Tax=Intestinirhabdus alba TaxID=2899544 RepID=A0A6L6IRT4_9ENTR|nr:cupin domain-containing protein [Intestinirhabdus alba]